MAYKLSIDLGATSLGWCIFLLDQDGSPVDILDMGVRIFSDGRDDKTKEPLAVTRRHARAMRRLIDRRSDRKASMMACLIRHGLMPKEQESRKKLETKDPYELRARAVREKISLHELGRALFHISRRRGFKSNRKTDALENDLGNMKAAIRDLDARLEGKTLGEYLYDLNKGKSNPARIPVRVRAHQENNKNVYNLYPSRKMYAKEVDRMLAHQRQHHPTLTEDICAEIKDILFFQRNLRTPKVGLCRLEAMNKELRARKAYPTVQKFRILQEVNNLALERFDENDPDLTPEQRQQIRDALLYTPKRTFTQLRTLLKLPRDSRFNLESDKRKEMLGDDTSAKLADEKAFGASWYSLTSEQQNNIVDLLAAATDRGELIITLMEDWELSLEQAENTADIRLKDGYGSLSLKAINKIMPFLEKGMIYPEAARAAGYHHADFRTGEVLDRLPYYGEVLPESVIGGSYEEEDRANPEKYYGRINNPTVHIALNQLRKLINTLLEDTDYGRPDQISIELARDLKKPANDINREQAQNKRDNDRINKELEKLRVSRNYTNRMIYKLWEDLASEPEKRCCPFTGKPIAQHRIFSGEFEVEHLLPFSQSYNNGRANKVLSCREANRRKGNRTPYEAFGHTAEWDDIIARAQNLPAYKRWRFQPDAMEIAKGQGEDVIARMLNDTRYMSRIAAKYLSFLYPEKGKGSHHVSAIPGQLTALLRQKWGLNDMLNDDGIDVKNRTDHRHHAIDAAVVGCTTRGMLKRMSDAARQLEENESLYEKRHKLVADMPIPFKSFKTKIADHLETLVVSYKPDHGGAFSAIRAKRPYTVAQLHRENPFGRVINPETNEKRFAKRTNINDFKGFEDKKQEGKGINSIADPAWRQRLTEAVKNIKPGSPEWKRALAEFSKKHNVRRLRTHVIKPEASMAKVPSRNPFKFYPTNGNYCAEIYCPDKGKNAGQWQCEIISNYHAHRKDFIPNWRQEHPTAKLIMRLHIDDMIAYEDAGQTVICRVKKMTKGLVYLRPHFIAKETADKLSWGASAKQLQLKNARKISVDILGRVKDPGPRNNKQDAAEAS